MINNANANGNGNANENTNLKVGDVFAVDHFKTFPSKFYPDRMNAKILTTDGDIVFTSAAKIIKILNMLSNDPEVTDLSKYTFEVVQAGEYKGHPVLSIYSDDKLVREKIQKIFF